MRWLYLVGFCLVISGCNRSETSHRKYVISKSPEILEAHEEAADIEIELP